MEGLSGEHLLEAGGHRGTAGRPENWRNADQMHFHNCLSRGTA